MTIPFSVSVDDLPDGSRIRLRGEIDASVLPRLREACAGAEDGRQVDIDLSGVTFIDSAGIGCLIGSIRRIKKAHGSVALLAPTDAIKRVLHLTGVDRIAPIVDGAGGDLSWPTRSLA